jgi:hypothetical protein
VFIVAQAFGIQRRDDEIAIADMMTVTIYVLLFTGEFTDTNSDDTPFRPQDIALYI